MDDHALKTALTDGNPLSMKAIFDRYYSSLCRLAFRMVNDRDQAKDIVQNVFIKLWNRRQELQITGSLESYLKKATFNTALNHLQERDRRQMQLTELEMVKPKSSTTPESEMIASEFREILKTAIGELPNRTRSIFTLIRSEEMSYKEVAEELQISTKAVEKEMMRALRLLKDSMKTHLDK